MEVYEIDDLCFDALQSGRKNQRANSKRLKGNKQNDLMKQIWAKRTFMQEF